MNTASQSASTGKSSSKIGVLRTIICLVLGLALCASMVPSQAQATAYRPHDDSFEQNIVVSESLVDLDDASHKSGTSARLHAANAPTLLSVVAASPTQVNVTWSPMSGARQYGVYRQVYGSRNANLIGTASGTSFTDSTASPGKLYGYAIVALLSDSSTSGRSNTEVVATPPRDTTASASATFPKGLTVKWKASEGATHYYVLRATKGSASFKVVQSTKSTSYLDTSAVGKKYVYKVRPIFVLENYELSHAADTAQVSSDSGKWKKKGTSKSFVFSNGKLAKNWQLINGKWYCFSSSGKMLKNSFKTTSGKKYYLGSNGAIKTGWISYKGNKYYGLKNGGLAKGWQTISGKRYYFSKSGVLAKNKFVNGYYVGKNGVWDGKVKYGSSVGTLTTTKSLLTKVNQARKKVGASSLKWDSGLAETAKLRATEIKKLFSHTRPNGTSCFTAFPSYLNGAGENIAMGQRSVSEVNIAWTNSPGHYSNMVNTMFNCFGAACFTINGTKYWVELFGRK